MVGFFLFAPEAPPPEGDPSPHHGGPSISPPTAARKRKGSSAFDPAGGSSDPASAFTMHNAPPLTIESVVSGAGQAGGQVWGTVARGLSYGRHEPVKPPAGGAPATGARGGGRDSGGGSLKRARTGSLSPVWGGSQDGGDEQGATFDGGEGGADVDNVKKELTRSPTQHTTSISWDDIVVQFQVVRKEESENVAFAGEKNVIIDGMDTVLVAPSFRRVTKDELEAKASSAEAEGEDMEDISDEAILRRHEEVLNRMREKLAFLKERRAGGNRRRASDAA